MKGRLLVNDVKKLSPTEQTSSLESFHNVVCHFAAKAVHYMYAQMEARYLLFLLDSALCAYCVYNSHMSCDARKRVLSMLRGFRPGPTQTGLNSHKRNLEA